MTTFVTADQHFGHARTLPDGSEHGIIQLCNRPFADVTEMNNVMQAKWNARVNNRDTVYILGDFAWSREEWEMWNELLTGQKVYLSGSHDWHRKKLPLMLRVTENRVTYYLSHWPLATWQPHTIMLHGHSHGRLPRKRWRCDVGVDCWDFAPITLEQAREYAECEVPDD
jgi:calcineurin-like phosphoesterase family protein